MPAKPRNKIANLVKRRNVIIGDPGRLPRIETFDEKKWRKKWEKRTSGQGSVMNILVEMEDDVLRQLSKIARKNRHSLNQELLDILERAARPEAWKATPKHKRPERNAR